MQVSSMQVNETDRQTERQTDRQKDRQTDRQTERALVYLTSSMAIGRLAPVEGNG